MGLFRVFFLVVSALGLAPSTKASCNENLGVTGGYKVSIKDAPFIASIIEVDPEDYDNSEVVCAGSIIHEHFILTAASCNNWDDETIERQVLVASTNLDSDENGAIIGVEDIFCHENFDNKLLNNDICLLKLESPVPFAWLVQVALPYKGFVLNEGTLVNATGWGATRRDADMETELRQVTVPILSQKCCDDIYEGFTADMICAGTRQRDFCKGDAGGPLTYKGVQVGVISGEGECGKHPGVYTRVTSYLDWINSTIKKNL